MNIRAIIAEEEFMDSDTCRSILVGHFIPDAVVMTKPDSNSKDWRVTYGSFERMTPPRNSTAGKPSISMPLSTTTVSDFATHRPDTTV